MSSSSALCACMRLMHARPRHAFVAGLQLGAEGTAERRQFSTSPSAAAAKAKAKKPALKKKTVLRKNVASGPRSVSARRKTESVGQVSGGLSKSSPFYLEDTQSSGLSALDPSSWTDREVGNMVSLSGNVANVLGSSRLGALRGNLVSNVSCRTDFECC